MTTTSPVLKQIAGLPKLSHGELKALWREYFGVEPPAYRRGFLIRGLAHRIQELTYGGLKPTYQARLDAMIEGTEKPNGAGSFAPGFVDRIARELPKVVDGLRVVISKVSPAPATEEVRNGYAERGEKIKAARTQRGLSQRKLGEMAGVNVAQTSQAENGLKKAGERAFAKLKLRSGWRDGGQRSDPRNRSLDQGLEERTHLLCRPARRVEGLGPGEWRQGPGRERANALPVLRRGSTATGNRTTANGATAWHYRSEGIRRSARLWIRARYGDTVLSDRPSFIVTFTVTPSCVRPLDSLKWLLKRAKGEGLKCTSLRIEAPDPPPVPLTMKEETS